MPERVARPPRFELGTLCLEGRRSIQLSYGRYFDSKRFPVSTTILKRHFFVVCNLSGSFDYFCFQGVRGSGATTSFDNATGRNVFVKKGWLARMADTCLSADLRRVRRASCNERAAPSPHELQSRKDSHHGNSRLQLVRRNSPR
jgi:hypothetical protein